MDIMAQHIPPIGDEGYQNVKFCNTCHYQIAAADAYPFGHICPRCGTPGADIVIARWVRVSPRWQIWKNEGHWMRKSEMATER